MRVPLSPYSVSEFLPVVWRRFTGPPPRPDVLDRNLEFRDLVPQRTIGFVGDICPLFGLEVRFGTGVQSFLAACDLLVGNFEGILTNRSWRPFLMKHSPAIFEVMDRINPLENWVVSVANNHATDYGTEALHRTVRRLDRRGLRWLGTADRPRLPLTDHLTLTAWTQWLNRSGEGVARHDPGAPAMPGLHVAVPHWGYEHERQPRPTQSAPDGYDLTVGHHPHVPQPFEHRNNGQLVAWSLGNFVTGKQLPVLGEGALLKVEIARPEADAPEIVRACFREIDLDRDRHECHVHIRHPHPPEAHHVGPTGGS